MQTKIHHVFWFPLKRFGWRDGRAFRSMAEPLLLLHKAAAPPSVKYSSILLFNDLAIQLRYRHFMRLSM